MSLTEGQIVEGTVVDILDYGAFVELENGKRGLVHISEVANSYVKDIKTVLSKEQKVKVKILKIENNGKYNLSIKQADENYKAKKSQDIQNRNSRQTVVSKPQNFEDVLSKFLKDSEDRQSGMKDYFESKNRRSCRK